MAINNIVSTIEISNGLEISETNLQLSPEYMRIAAGTISPAAFKDMMANPVVIVPGVANTIVLPLVMTIWLNYNSVQYVGGDNVYFGFPDSLKNISTAIPNTQFQGAASEISSATLSIPHPNTLADFEGLDFAVGVNLGANFTTGDSDIGYYIQYCLLPAN